MTDNKIFDMHRILDTIYQSLVFSYMRLNYLYLSMFIVNSLRSISSRVAAIISVSRYSIVVGFR